MCEILAQQWQIICSTSWPLLLTLAGFAIAWWTYNRSGRASLLHPLMIATPLIYFTMQIIDLGFAAYYSGNGILNWLLGPATGSGSASFPAIAPAPRDV